MIVSHFFVVKLFSARKNQNNHCDIARGIWNNLGLSSLSTRSNIFTTLIVALRMFFGLLCFILLVFNLLALEFNYEEP